MLLLFNFKALDSPKQAIKRLVDAIIAQNFIGCADRLELGQGGAELGLAHRPLPRKNRSHSPELKVQCQDLVRETANRVDQINHDLSLATIHRHGNFSTARTTVARAHVKASSNLNASDGGRG